MAFIRHAPCPACGSKDNVAIYQDGDKYNGSCQGCGQLYWDIDPGSDDFRPKEDPGQYSTYQGVQEDVQEILQLPTMPIPARGISAQNARECGIRVRVDGSGRVNTIYYPYWRAGEVVAFKKRVLPKTFSTLGDFKGVGLYGAHVYAEGGKFIIVTEGEDDRENAIEMLRKFGKNYRVVSVQTGATVNEDGIGVMDKPLKRQIPWLMKFQTVVLCLDQDSPGQALALVMAQALAGECEVKFMTFSEKDAQKMAEKGLEQEFYQSLKDATTYVPETIMRGQDVELEWLMQAMTPGLSLPYPRLSKKMMGLRMGKDGGELTLVCAGTGIGKTTFCREVGFHFKTVHGINVGNVYLEEQAKKTMQGYIALRYNVPLKDLRVKPTLLTQEQWEQGKKELVDGSTFYNHFGSLASEKLISEMRYMHTREGAKLILLDHISLVVSGQEESRGGERKDIDLLMTKLAAFVTVTGCHVLAVVHLKRRSAFVKKDQDGKIDKDTAPYDRGGRISINDLRGSAGLEQMAFNIITIEGDQYPEDQREVNVRTARLVKCRETGDIGTADVIRYTPDTGRFLPIG